MFSPTASPQVWVFRTSRPGHGLELPAHLLQGADERFAQKAAHGGRETHLRLNVVQFVSTSIEKQKSFDPTDVSQPGRRRSLDGARTVSEATQRPWARPVSLVLLADAPTGSSVIHNLRMEKSAQRFGLGETSG